MNENLLKNWARLISSFFSWSKIDDSLCPDVFAESDDWLNCVVGLFLKPSKFWIAASRLEGAAWPILSVVGLVVVTGAFAVVSVLLIGGKGGGGGGAVVERDVGICGGSGGGGGGMDNVVLGGIDGTAGGDVIVVDIFCGGEGDEDWGGGMGA